MFASLATRSHIKIFLVFFCKKKIYYFARLRQAHLVYQFTDVIAPCRSRRFPHCRLRKTDKILPAHIPISFIPSLASPPSPKPPDLLCLCVVFAFLWALQRLWWWWVSLSSCILFCFLSFFFSLWQALHTQTRLQSNVALVK